MPEIRPTESFDIFYDAISEEQAHAPQPTVQNPVRKGRHDETDRTFETRPQTDLTRVVPLAAGTLDALQTPASADTTPPRTAKDAETRRPVIPVESVPDTGGRDALRMAESATSRLAGSTQLYAPMLNSGAERASVGVGTEASTRAAVDPSGASVGTTLPTGQDVGAFAHR